MKDVVSQAVEMETEKVNFLKEMVETYSLPDTSWHRKQARLPLRDKVRVLLELQRQELPLLARRPLRSWERPWEITP